MRSYDLYYKTDTKEDSVQRVQIEPERTGWARLSDLLRKYDQDRIQDAKEDIDTLLVFVGLFHPPGLNDTYKQLNPLGWSILSGGYYLRCRVIQKSSTPAGRHHEPNSSATFPPISQPYCLRSLRKLHCAYIHSSIFRDPKILHPHKLFMVPKCRHRTHDSITRHPRQAMVP